MAVNLMIYVVGCIFLHGTELLKVRRRNLKNRENSIKQEKAASIITCGRILLWPMLALAFVCLIPAFICMWFEIYIEGLYPIDIEKEQEEKGGCEICEF